MERLLRAVQHGDGHSSMKILMAHHHLADHGSINPIIGGLFAPVYLFMIPSVNPQPEKRTVQKAAAFDYG